jgi:hypothetical protein
VWKGREKTRGKKVGDRKKKKKLKGEKKRRTRRIVGG